MMTDWSGRSWLLATLFQLGWLAGTTQNSSLVVIDRIACSCSGHPGIKQGLVSTNAAITMFGGGHQSLILALFWRGSGHQYLIADPAMSVPLYAFPSTLYTLTCELLQPIFTLSNESVLCMILRTCSAITPT